MSIVNYRALVIEEIEAEKYVHSIKYCAIENLAENQILIQVKYSGLNYKDALSYRGHKGITRKYPHTPGIDAAGKIIKSNSKKFDSGEEVFVTGYDLGMNTNGGFGEYIAVPDTWVVRMPVRFDLRKSMIYGTAGFTAGIAINELQKFGIYPDSGQLLVTGATGAVGTLAISMLSKVGYNVTASTGKPDCTELLKNLGANEVINRNDIIDASDKPLLKGKWSAVIENVGGSTLSSVIRSVKQWGAVAVIGNVTGDVLNTSVYPFILRGVSLIGIDSAERPMTYRENIWHRIALEWYNENVFSAVKEIKLEQVPSELEKMLSGEQRGKVIVSIE